jgi:signal transduction histidine kinase
MADRMAATITYVRRIARRAPPQTEPLDLNTLTRDAVEDAQQTLPDRRIILRFEPARDPASARALGDPLQIRQVITNLVRNGIDACQQSKGRQVVVRVFVEPDALAVAVTDAGPGVSARNLPHLFEPFFTTKPDGTGLGLSLSRSIAEAHGGSLRLEDAKRGRCTFVLRLPRTSALEER